MSISANAKAEKTPRQIVLGLISSLFEPTINAIPITTNSAPTVFTNQTSVLGPVTAIKVRKLKKGHRAVMR